MNVDILLVEGGVLPARGSDAAAGWDCYARQEMTLWPSLTSRGSYVGLNYSTPQRISLGFKMSLPRGYYAQICPRSGLTSDGIVCMVGTIDSDYRGEVCALIYNFTWDAYVVRKGERIAQMIIKKHEDVYWNAVAELDKTARGEGGFGSSGR